MTTQEINTKISEQQEKLNNIIESIETEKGYIENMPFYSDKFLKRDIIERDYLIKSIKRLNTILLFS